MGEGGASSDVAPESTAVAEAKRTSDARPEPGMHDMPLRQYLDTYVSPTLMPGLKALGEERPENPVEWLAQYLMKNNPDPKRTAGAEENSPAKEEPKDE